MRMADLTRVSGVPTATIKFYLREGLLQPGQRTAPNQARYGEEHLRRLRLIRALRETGQLRIDTIRRVLASVDGAENPWEVVGNVCDAIGEASRNAAQDRAAADRATADVDAFLAAQGLPIRESSTARAQIIDALVAIRSAFGQQFPAQGFTLYSTTISAIAKNEVAFAGAMSRGMAADTGDLEAPVGSGPFDLSRMLEAVVYGTVLFEPVLLALRRLWHEHYAESTMG
jgi:DNA-binding transcriptional MerR regulator